MRAVQGAHDMTPLLPVQHMAMAMAGRMAKHRHEARTIMAVVVAPRASWLPSSVSASVVSVPNSRPYLLHVLTLGRCRTLLDYGVVQCKG